MANQTSYAVVSDGDYLSEGYFNELQAGVIKAEAGETITAKDVVYFNVSDGKVYVSDLATKLDIRANGIALTGVSSGSDVSVQIGGIWTTTGLTDKATYYLGVAGALIKTFTAVKIGVANGTTQLILDIVQDDRDQIGTIKAWNKTYGSADSGNTDGIGGGTSILKDSGQNFNTTIKPGMIVRNTTDGTYAWVTVVTSDTELAISSDIMDDSENYTIYKTVALNALWAECDNSVISDSESPYNGETLPNLNLSGASGRFLRGGTSSNVLTGNVNRVQMHSGLSSGAASGGGFASNVDWPADNGQVTFQEEPALTVFWIMKIK